MAPERYWAVRIGNPRKHLTYLMLNTDNSGTPALFTSRPKAEDAALKGVSKRTECKIVRVELRELRGS